MASEVSVFAKRRVAEESTGTLANVIVFASSTASDISCAFLVQDRPGHSPWVSECFPGSFIQFDFQEDPIVISSYELVFSEISGFELLRPKEIVIEVSNNAQKWEVIDRQRFESSISSVKGVVVEDQLRVARFVRISQPERNFNDTDSFVLQSIDIRSRVYTEIIKN
jgi:hypothetical protein